jgi:hypothetical protein
MDTPQNESLEYLVFDSNNITSNMHGSFVSLTSLKTLHIMDHTSHGSLKKLHAIGINHIRLNNLIWEGWYHQIGTSSSQVPYGILQDYDRNGKVETKIPIRVYLKLTESASAEAEEKEEEDAKE